MNVRLKSIKLIANAKRVDSKLRRQMKDLKKLKSDIIIFTRLSVKLLQRRAGRQEAIQQARDGRLKAGNATCAGTSNLP